MTVDMWIAMGGGFFLGIVAGMYIHYYHGESLASDGEKN